MRAAGGMPSVSYDAERELRRTREGRAEHELRCTREKHAEHERLGGARHAEHELRRTRELHAEHELRRTS